jgi:CBS domain-containing protein
MFSIYGEDGRMFRGPMEELLQVEALRATMRARRMRDDPQRQAQLLAERQSAYRAAAQAIDKPVESATEAPQQGPQGGPLSFVASEALSAYAQAAGKKRDPHERQPLKTVADVMTPNPVTVSSALSVFEAWRLLGARGVGQAPVLAARNDAAKGIRQGDLVGLISRADLLDLRRLPKPDAPADAWRDMLMHPVAAVMFSPVPATSPQTGLRRVARVLLDTRLPGLPVQEDGGGENKHRLVGFISRSDILKAVVNDPPLDLWS